MHFILTQFKRSVLSIVLIPIFLLAESNNSGESSQIKNQHHLNWSGHDYAPRISPDGRYLLFQSNRPGSFAGQNLWFSINNNWPKHNAISKWSAPRTLFMPLSGMPSATMQNFRPTGTIKDPDGAFSVNSDGLEGMAAFVFRNAEPVEIYFTSLRNDSLGRDGQAGLNIYFSRYRDKRWSKVVHINELNSDFDDKMPYVSPDGKKMYFISNRPGGYGKNDIWYSERNLKTGLWSNPVNAGSKWNSAWNEISPTLAHDARLLFFSSDRPGGFGHYDLYVSEHSGMQWENVRNLGAPFNSARDDESLTMTHDGRWTYFTSDRVFETAKGGFDVYRVATPNWLYKSVPILFQGLVLDGSTRLPLGIEATIKIVYAKNTIIKISKVILKNNNETQVNNFSLKLDSKRIYRMIVSAPGFHPTEIQLNYSGQIPNGSVDRRQFYLQPIIPKATDPNFLYKTLAGRVLNKHSGAPISNANITISNNFSKLPIKIQTDREGRFSVKVVKDKTFVVSATALGFHENTLSFVDHSGLRNIIIPLKRIGGNDPCKYLELGCIGRTRIYFDSNKSVVREIEHEKLKRLALILKQNPNVMIDIAGHTDQIHTAEYNQKLSESRAHQVQLYLSKLGVSKNRLIIFGYGFKSPLVKDEKTEGDRQQNRRVEFRIHQSE